MLELNSKPDLTGVHDTATCPCEMCTWTNLRRSRCILHPDQFAAGDAQGIPVCADDYRRYSDERRMSDGQFPRRPFLQQLIKASASRENNFK
jgi:hypothetical protein